MKVNRPTLRSLLAATMVCGAAIAQSGAAIAATSSASFQVTAQVNASCSVSATNLAFGTYDPTAATALTATSNISVTCTPGTAFAVGLNAGTGASATVTNRSMQGSAGGSLSYGLYTDSGYKTNWNDITSTSTPTNPGPGVPTGTAPFATVTTLSFPVYGSISPAQYVSPGTYTDTITATVLY